jgi:hypothetical protein
VLLAGYSEEDKASVVKTGTERLPDCINAVVMASVVMAPVTMNVSVSDRSKVLAGAKVVAVSVPKPLELLGQATVV